MRDNAQDAKNKDGLNGMNEQIDLEKKKVDDATEAVNKIRLEAAEAGVEIPMPGQGVIERSEAELAEKKNDLLKAQEDYDSRRILLEKLQGLGDQDFIDTLSAMGHEEPNIATLNAECLKNRE